MPNQPPEKDQFRLTEVVDVSQTTITLTLDCHQIRLFFRTLSTFVLYPFS